MLSFRCHFISWWTTALSEIWMVGHFVEKDRVEGDDIFTGSRWWKIQALGIFYWDNLQSSSTIPIVCLCCVLTQMNLGSCCVWLNALISRPFWIIRIISVRSADWFFVGVVVVETICSKTGIMGILLRIIRYLISSMLHMHIWRLVIRYDWISRRSLFAIRTVASVAFWFALSIS